MHSWLIFLLAGLAEKSIFMSGFGFLRGKAPCKGSELQRWCTFPCTCSQLATRHVSTMMLRGDQRSYDLCESQGGRGKSSGLAGCLGCRGRSCTSAGPCLFPIFHSLSCSLCSWCAPAGQHGGVDVSACVAGWEFPKEPHPPGACRFKVVQSLGTFLDIKPHRKMGFFCISFCIRSLLNGSVLMCPIDSSDQEFWEFCHVWQSSLGCWF